MSSRPIDTKNEFDRLANASVSGVYIIRGRVGLRKIGMTRRLDGRLAALQGANPQPLAVEFFEEYGERARQIEKGAHRLLAPWRHRGEWFSATRPLAEMAIEAARDDCPRLRQFFFLHAEECRARHGRIKSRIRSALYAKFPDLCARAYPQVEEEFMTEEEWTAARGLRDLANDSAERALGFLSEMPTQLWLAARYPQCKALRAVISLGIKRLQIAA